MTAAKEQLVSDHFLSNFAHIFTNFSHEEIQALIHIYQNPAMRKFLKLPKHCLSEFFETAKELFVQESEEVLPE